MSRVLAPLLAGACFAVFQAKADADPAAWLVRVSEASRQANFQGTLVYRTDDRLETLRVAHRLRNGREQERLTSLTGGRRDVFRENDRVVVVGAEAPQEIRLVSDRMMPAVTADLLQQLEAHYDLDELGDSRVAGRPVRGVSITPRDALRYGYVVWADTETAVPLKVSLVDAENQVIEQMMYTEIDYRSRPPDALFTPPPGTRPLQAAAVETVPVTTTPVVAPSAWALDRLPPGFAVTLRTVRPMSDGDDVVEHIQLSDGLSAVSVFSARSHEPEQIFSGSSSLGAMSVYARRIGDYHVTVVGEVPTGTVRMIGEGVRQLASEPSAE